MDFPLLLNFIVSFAIAITAALWVSSDARRQGYNSKTRILWSVGTFLIMIIFLPAYLIFRSTQKKETKTPEDKPCVYCNESCSVNAKVCQHCGRLL